MFLPRPTTTHWVYDDPSGLPESPAPTAAQQPAVRRGKGKVLPLPVRPVPATPKAA